MSESLGPSVYAIDGVGGSGKSHVIRGLQRLLDEEGRTSVVYKISGLGDSPRVAQLKMINECREQMLAADKAPEKVRADKRNDRIFRLASAYQTRLFEKERLTLTQDTIFLDRTPMLHWVYSASADPENPSLKEMHEEGIELMRRLGVSRTFLLTVAPSTAFARLIARGVALEPSVDEQARKIEELSRMVGAPADEHAVIHEKTFHLLKNVKIEPKALVRWDFIPYRIMQDECLRYQEAVSDAERILGIPFTIVDAELPSDEVISTIQKSIHRLY